MRQNSDNIMKIQNTLLLVMLLLASIVLSQSYSLNGSWRVQGANKCSLLSDTITLEKTSDEFSVLDTSISHLHFLKDSSLKYCNDHLVVEESKNAWSVNCKEPQGCLDYSNATWLISNDTISLVFLNKYYELKSIYEQTIQDKKKKIKEREKMIEE